MGPSGRKRVWGHVRRGFHPYLVERLDLPGLGESLIQISSGDPARAGPGWLLFAETEQPQTTTRSEHLADRLDICPAIRIGQYVEQAAIDDIVELSWELAESQCIDHHETGIKLSGSGLGFGLCNDFRDEINSVDRMAAGGKEQRAIARPAAGIEDRPFDLVGHGDQGRLRMADLPRRLLRIGFAKMVGLGGRFRHCDVTCVCGNCETVRSENVLICVA